MRERKGPSWGERLAELRRCGWYWGDLGWKEAEALLEKAPVGSYLVRDSRNEAHLFTVSYRIESGIYHSRINLFGGELHLGGPSSIEHNTSVVALVDSAVRNAQQGGLNILIHKKGEEADATPLNLETPLKRHEVLPPLHYLCRVLIRERVSAEDCSNLPLPAPLREYLADPRYLIPPLPEPEAARRKKKRR